MPLLIFLTAVAALIIACMGLLSTTERQGTVCLIIAILLIIAVPVEFLVDSKYYRPERIKEEKQKIYNRYKNGPVEIKRNGIGCIKYEYYNDNFWTCPDKSITQIEERVGKHTVETPVVHNK